VLLDPALYLHEIADRFRAEWVTSICVTTVWRILESFGLTLKVLERRAIGIKLHDIARYTDELNSLPWLTESLVFIDEVSFDCTTTDALEGALQVAVAQGWHPPTGVSLACLSCFSFRRGVSWTWS
jgi:hypothetical protein